LEKRKEGGEGESMQIVILRLFHSISQALYSYWYWVFC